MALKLAGKPRVFAIFTKEKKERFSKGHAPTNAIEEKIGQAEIADMIVNTRTLAMRRVLKQLKFNLELSEELLKADEWTVERTMVDPHMSVTRITNGLSFEGKQAAFETSGILERARSLEIPDYEMVCGCTVRRSDDPKQSVLVLATPTHLDIYSLNGSGEIENSRAGLGALEIGKKARVVVANAEQITPFGKGLYLGVVDESEYERIAAGIREKTAKAPKAKRRPKRSSAKSGKDRRNRRKH
ncbi:MAG: hypothetical protein PHS02_02405 [Candidatus ainarchaeum sp.]|nr:hypothetical protein [Candidatus ainarchaeum sp.]